MEIPELQVTGNAEADTMLVYYASTLSVGGKPVVVQSDDADVFILMLHHHSNMAGTMYMDMGHDGKSNYRLHNMTALSEHFVPPVYVNETYFFFVLELAGKLDVVIKMHQHVCKAHAVWFINFKMII